MTLKEILFALLRVEICGGDLPVELQKGLAIEELQKLYTLSKSHDLAHLIGDALLKHDLIKKDQEIYKKFLAQQRMAVYRREQLNYELNCISAVLTQAKIKHIPLKGAILSRYYPENWMRTSCDIDIFVDESDLEKATNAIFEHLQYEVKGKSPHDMQLYSQNDVHLELHFTLIEDYRFPKMEKVLSQIWKYADCEEGNEFCLYNTPEFFIFYHIAHAAKHFITGGCGIRPFLDLWIMERKMPYDKEKLREMLKEGGLLTFYENANHLAEFWFSGIESSDTVKAMEEYILRGGVYGTTENKVAVSREKPKNKFLFVLSCIFLSHENLCHVYPSLKGKKWLTPFYQVRRWFRIIFKGASKNTRSTLRAYDSVSKEQKQDVKNLLDNLGLGIESGRGF